MVHLFIIYAGYIPNTQNHYCCIGVISDVLLTVRTIVDLTAALNMVHVVMVLSIVQDVVMPFSFKHVVLELICIMQVKIMYLLLCYCFLNRFPNYFIN